MMLRRFSFCIVMIAMLCGFIAISFAADNGKLGSTAEELQVPERKQTTIGLYVTAAQAYEMWKVAPDEVKIIDVRTPEEYAFIGHPEMAWNIPLAFVTYQRKNGKTEYQVKWNPDFVSEVESIAKLPDILLVTCRSGDRSAKAVNMLAEAGFTNVYNIFDGVEGDKVDDPGSVFVGKRMRNGWKNSAPWVYGFDPEKLILEEAAAEPAQ